MSKKLYIVMLFSILVGLKIEGAESLLDKVKNFFSGSQKIDMPELHLAAEKGDIEKVRQLIASGANVDFKKPIYYAIWHKHYPVTKLLLDSGAKTDILSDNGFSLLLCAYITGDVDTIRMLFENGVKINSLEQNDLFNLAFKGRRCDDLLNLLLDHIDNIDDSKIKRISTHVETPLPRDGNALIREELSQKLTRIKQARAEHQQAILEETIKATMNDTDENDFTPLMNAALSGDLEKVTLLLRLGADVNFVNVDGSTALVCALRPDNTHAKQIVNVLLQADADTSNVGEEILNEILTLED